MNILHHKSWHVRTKKNIEKVRKDEQRALEEQIEKARKADTAEQERRIQKLRSKFNVNQRSDGQQQSTGDRRSTDNRRFDNQQQSGKEHINFFKPEYDHRVNKAHELEKKIEQEQWEKKVGILTYLGGNQRNDLPWYEKLPTQLDKEISYKDLSVLDNNDPLNKIKKELNKRKEVNKLKQDVDSAKQFSRQSRNSDERKCHKRSSSSRQLDRREDKQAVKSNEIDRTQLSEKELKLSLLREKRLKRERDESKRSKNLFTNTNLFDHCLNERERAYSNQFNPHLCRK